MNSKYQEINTVPAPRLRFPGFTRAWEEKKLGEFLTESRLVGSDGAKARKITVKLWGKGVYEKQDAIKGSENTKYFKRRAGQLIYSKLDFLNGAFGLIPQELDGLESTLDLPCFDFSGDLNPQYILEYISREEFYSKFEGGALGGRKARRVTPEEFLNFPLPLPSLPEQTRIAAALSSLDAVIAAHQCKQDALREHKRGLMAGLFPTEGERVPRLRFPEFERAVKWEERKLSDTAIEIFDGDWIESKDQSDAGIRIIQTGNVGVGEYIPKIKSARYISEETFNNLGCTEIFPNDCLVSRLPDPVGRSCIMPDIGERMATVVDCAVVRFNKKMLKPEFFLQISQLESYFLKIDRLASGSTRKRVSRENLSKLVIPVPSLPEQTRIAAALSSIDELITAQGEKIAALQELKRGLMQGLFPRSVQE